MGIGDWGLGTGDWGLGTGDTSTSSVHRWGLGTEGYSDFRLVPSLQAGNVFS
ncbi:MAG: hypothetical protein ACSI46_12855 [Gloeotrichia echinulata DVL01]